MSDHPETEIRIALPEGAAGRLDKALSAAAPEGLSRSRLQALIASGAVSLLGQVETDPKTRVQAGQIWTVHLPPAIATEAEPEAIPLVIVHEDEDLIVVDKPAPMVVHPAPGSETGTLVNALLHHCGASLSGIGGVQRPGIVHRIDKDTSGVLVVAKSDRAHHGLAAQFAAHSVERSYLAMVWGEPSAADPRLRGVAGVSFEPGGIVRLSGNIARHRTDRKRMAVVRDAGRHAITRVRVREVFGAGKPVTSLVECRLETGRTHQIRVHMTHAGHALIGDPVYGSPRAIPKAALPEDVANMVKRFPRQALHAASLGFVHPANGQMLQFHADPPEDFKSLLTSLRQSKD